MNKQNAKRWGIVTFSASLMCGTVGHYLPIEAAAFFVPAIAFFLSLLGTFSVEMDQ